jgi:hypothetical protein
MGSPRLLLHFLFRLWSVSFCSSTVPKRKFSFILLSEENLIPLLVDGNELTGTQRNKLHGADSLIELRGPQLVKKWHSEFHGCIHNSPSPARVLSQINPVHAPHPTSWRYFLSCLPCLGFQVVFFFRLPHTYYIPSPSLDLMTWTIFCEYISKAPRYVVFSSPLFSRLS